MLASPRLRLLQHLLLGWQTSVVLGFYARVDIGSSAFGARCFELPQVALTSVSS